MTDKYNKVNILISLILIKQLHKISISPSTDACVIVRQLLYYIGREVISVA